MKMEKFHKTTDSALNLPTEREKTVGDGIQKKRNEQAALLREQRRMRDELREQARQDEADSQKKANQILRYIRSIDDPRQPEVLKVNAQQKNQTADAVQQELQNRRYALPSILGREDKELMLQAQGKLFASLSSVEYAAAGREKSSRDQAIEALEGVSYDDLKSAVFSEYRDPYQKQGLAQETLDGINQIGKTARKNASVDMSFLNVFDSFNSRLLNDILTEKPEIFRQYPENALPLIMNIGWDIDESTKEKLLKSIEPISQEALTKMFDSSDQRFTLNKLLAFGSESARDFLDSKIQENFFTGELSGSFYEILQYPDLANFFLKKMAELVSGEFGIADSTHFVERWKEGKGFNISSLYRMRELERAQEGAVAFLHKHYGITEFVRYPAEMLLEQLSQHGKDVPYGVMVLPAEDYNEVFDTNTQDFFDIYEKTKGRHVTRIFEADSLVDLARGIVQLRGFNHKIEYLLLGAHGWPEGMRFGKDALTINTLTEKPEVFEQVKKLLAEDTRVVLNSCSTGASEGFAQALSASLEREVLAPVIDAINPKLSIVYEGGHPRLEENFNVPQALYNNGQKIEE